jgi:hypothetical protein
MTCHDIRPLLPSHAYGDLPDADAAAVAAHLRTCSACRAEIAAIEQVRLALDAKPTPPVHVDVPALFHAAAEQRTRRWRRLAIAGAALAAGLLLVVGLRLSVTIGNGQVVIAWGGPKASGVALAPRVLPSQNDLGALTQPRSPDLDDRIRVLQELTHALAADIDARDRRQQSETDALRARLDAFQRLTFNRLADAERMASALYVAQFQRPEEKQNP